MSPESTNRGLTGIRALDANRCDTPFMIFYDEESDGDEYVLPCVFGHPEDRNASSIRVRIEDHRMRDCETNIPLSISAVEVSFDGACSVYSPARQVGPALVPSVVLAHLCEHCGLLFR